MGGQIFYCNICGGQIRSADLENGQAFEIENRKFCLKCGPEMLRTLLVSFAVFTLLYIGFVTARYGLALAEEAHDAA